MAYYQALLAFLLAFWESAVKSNRALAMPFAAASIVLHVRPLGRRSSK
jgi:hypothetical protein